LNPPRTTAELDNAYLYLTGEAGNMTLTVAPGMTISGSGSISNNGNSNTLVNRGIITADVDAQTLTVSPSNLINEGTLRASNGGLLDVAASVASSPGGI